MKNILRLIIDALGFIIEQAAEQMGIVKYATVKNSWLHGVVGRVDQMIVYMRDGIAYIKSRPKTFNMKDKAYWNSKQDKFRGMVNLAGRLNQNLNDMYESRPPGKNLISILTGQVHKFWGGGPAPIPYVFAPGTIETIIGNGTMPDAREATFTPSAGYSLQITWNPGVVYPMEHEDDILQVMMIAKDGKAGMWLPSVNRPGVTRDAGTCTFTVIKDNVCSSTLQIYCAVKFKAGSLGGGKINGPFRFPVGVLPITLIP